MKSVVVGKTKAWEMHRTGVRYTRVPLPSRKRVFSDGYDAGYYDAGKDSKLDDDPEVLRIWRTECKQNQYGSGFECKDCFYFKRCKRIRKERGV